MNKLKVGTKLIGGFILVALLALGVGLFAVNKIQALGAADQTLYEFGTAPFQYITDIGVDFQKLRLLATQISYTHDNDEIKTKEQSVKVLADTIQFDLDSVKATLLTPVGKENLEKVRSYLGAYVISISELSRLAEDPKKAQEATRKVGEMRELASKLGDVVGQLTDLKVQAAKEIAAKNSALAESVSKITLIFLGIAVLLALFLGIWISRSITKPLGELVALANSVAEGDLSKKVTVTTEDEVGLLGSAVNAMVENLRNVVGNIKTNAQTVSSSSEELSAVSHQLLTSAEEMVNQSVTVASTTEQMSTNINNMASAAEEMSVNANEVAGAAEQLSQNMNAVSSAVEEMSVSIAQISQEADQARRVSDQASVSSRTATETMGKLGEAAKEIGNVTEVIKRIADKTNLLALNATIEAASAGEAGKGFAVVANEIKELANQSARAADDIARRIEGVQENTGSAVKVIEDVSNVIVKIGDSVQGIARAVEQQTKAGSDISSNVIQASKGAKNIASAISEVAKGANDVSMNSGEAAKGSRDVSTNISGVKSAADESNKGAEQVNKAASDLAKMAGDLEVTVSRFKI